MYRTITVPIVHSIYSQSAQAGVRSWLVDNDAGRYCKCWRLQRAVFLPLPLHPKK